MTATKIRQSELMAKHKMLPGEIVKFRDEKLKRDTDWWKEGTVIYWSEEAANLLAGGTPEPAAAPEPVKGEEIIQLRIAKPCPNKRFVIGDLNGFKAIVRCHPKDSRRLIGKTVSVRLTREGEETIYEYIP